jgi:transposase-like protein
MWQFAGVCRPSRLQTYVRFNGKKDRTLDKQSLQLALDQGLSIERIAKRFGRDPSTVSYWMKKHGLASPYREKHAARGAVDRDQLEQMAEAGMTIAEMAKEVGRSKATVRHWLRRYELRTQHSRGRRPLEVARAARDAGLHTTVMTCSRHGDTQCEGRGHCRCKRCRAEAVVRHRRKVKARLVEEAGGRCCLCGYDRCAGALEFHHLDPGDKLYEVSKYGVTISLQAARTEAAKCVLLCSNCHAEVERGFADLPATVAAPGEAPNANCPGQLKRITPG